MAAGFFPELIANMPEADIPFPGVRGWILQGGDRQAVFLDIEPGDAPTHSHGEQWGAIVDGEMELTIGDQTQLRKRGDTYHIPSGTSHSARFLSRVRLIEVFADADRFKAK